MQGGMMAVGLSANDVKPYLEQVAKDLGSRRLVVACVNSPLNITVSGDELHLDHLKALLDTASAELFARKLKVKLAYHSFQMLEVADEYVARLGQLGPPPVPASHRHTHAPVMASSVTGEWIGRDELAKPTYWARNLVSPVLFSDALATMCASADTASWRGVTKKLDGSHAKTVTVTEIVEIGPHSVLQGPTREVLQSIGKESGVRYVSALVRGKSATTTILELAGRLHCLGHKVQLEQVNQITTAKIKGSMPHKALVTLPEYPFNHSKSYWAESRLSQAFRFRKFKRHDLLGAQSFDWNQSEAKWRHFIRVSDLPWVEQHKINGTTLYPAAGMMIMAIEAARQLADPVRELAGFILRDVAFQTALTIPSSAHGIEVNLHVRPRKDTGEKDAGWLDFVLYCYDASNLGSWNEIFNGSIQLTYTDAVEDDDAMGKAKEDQAWETSRLAHALRVKAACRQDADPGTLYEKLAESGYGYGPSFQGIKHMVFDGTGSSVSTVQTYRWSRHFEGPDPGTDHIVHPTTLDTILHTMLAVYTQGGAQKIATTIPTFVERMWISAKGGLSASTANAITVFTTGRRSGLRESQATLIVTDPEIQSVLIDIDGFQTTAVAADTEGSGTEKASVKPAYTLEWKPDPTLSSAAQLQRFYDKSATNAGSESKEWHQGLVQLIRATISRTLEAIQSHESVTPMCSTYVEWMKRQASSLRDCETELLDEDAYQELTSKLEGGTQQARLLASIARKHTALLINKEHPPDMPSIDVLIQQYLEHIVSRQA